jgi:hypothetical protein
VRLTSFSPGSIPGILKLLEKPSIKESGGMHKAISPADFFDATELAITLQANELLTHAYVLTGERLKLVVGWAISGDESPDETSAEMSADESKIELGCYLEEVSRLPSQVRSS